MWRTRPATPATRLLGIDDVVDVTLRDGHCLVRRSGAVHCWAPEDAPTLLPQNPLPDDARVPAVDDATRVSGDLILRRDGSLARVEFTHDAVDGATQSAVPFHADALHDVTDLDGSSQRGCAVTAPGAVTCWR